MVEENSVLVNMPIKLQTLLHQFIQLYDRLAVEHSLMTERELKLLKRLEKLNETLEHLHKTIEILNKFEPQVVKLMEELNQNSINELDVKLSEAIKVNIEKKLSNNLNYYCSVFREATNKFEEITKKQKETDENAFFMMLIIVGLICLLVGIIIGRYVF